MRYLRVDRCCWNDAFLERSVIKDEEEAGLLANQ
jgi:hypothetical protein